MFDQTGTYFAELVIIFMILIVGTGIVHTLAILFMKTSCSELAYGSLFTIPIMTHSYRKRK